MSTPFTAFILCTPCTHCMCCHCHIGHLISRIRNVYIWYIHSYVMHYMVYISIHKVHSVYNMYTPGFIFKAVYIRPSYIYALSSVQYFHIVPVACGCLLVSSTPPREPGQQYSFIVYTLKNGYLISKRVVYSTLHLSK